ncbi:MAG: TlpA disulfide reductase family protein [Myxococcota bacterium]
MSGACSQTLGLWTLVALLATACSSEKLPPIHQTALRGAVTATTARWMPMLEAKGDWREVGSDRIVVADQPLLRFRAPTRPTIYAFWATYCPPCFSELPVLMRAHNTGRAEVISVSLDASQTGLAAAALAHHRVQHRSVVLTKDSLPTVGDRLPQGLPFSLIVNTDGQVIGHHSGILDDLRLTALLDRGQE